MPRARGWRLDGGTSEVTEASGRRGGARGGRGCSGLRSSASRLPSGVLCGPPRGQERGPLLNRPPEKQKPRELQAINPDVAKT